jgi:hypothetical protein
MADEQSADRRLQPRWRTQEGVYCQLSVRTRVRVIDISGSGVLFGSDVPLPIGTDARLRSMIGNGSFAPAIEVRRVAPSSAQRENALGAIFTSMDDLSRRSLENFLKLASA